MTSALENAMSTIVQVFHDYAAEGDCLEFDGFLQLLKENCSTFLSSKCTPDTSEDECIQKLFTDTDSDGDGCITFNEFCTVLATVMEDEHNYAHRRGNSA